MTTSFKLVQGRFGEAVMAEIVAEDPQPNAGLKIRLAGQILLAVVRIDGYWLEK